MMERAEGRGDRTEFPDLLTQLDTLDRFFDDALMAEEGEGGGEAGSATPLTGSILFHAEVLAHTLLRMLRAIAFARRLGIPRNELDVLGLFQADGAWDLSQGRRFKQFLELRNLSTRNLAQIDTTGVIESLRARNEWTHLVRGLHGALER